MSRYYRDLRKVVLLSSKEQEKLCKKMKKGDIDARNKLFESCILWIVKVVRKYRSPTHVDFDDLLEDCNLHVLSKIHLWNPNKGKLSTFVYWVTSNLLNKDLRKYSPIYISSRMSANVRSSDFKERLEKAPSATHRINMIRAYNIIYNSQSNIKLSEFDRSYEQDFLPTDNVKESIFDKVCKTQALSGVDDRTKKILFYRYHKNMTNDEIGDILNISRERVRQIAQKVIDEIRTEFQIRHGNVSFAN